MSDVHLKELGDKLQDDVRDFVEAALDRLDEMDSDADGWLDPKTAALIGDFLERARPELPNHFIAELDSLLREIGR